MQGLTLILQKKMPQAKLNLFFDPNEYQYHEYVMSSVLQAGRPARRKTVCPSWRGKTSLFDMRLHANFSTIFFHTCHAYRHRTGEAPEGDVNDPINDLETEMPHLLDAFPLA